VRIPTPVWEAAEERVGKNHMAALITRLLERDNAAAVRRQKVAAAQAHPLEGDPRNNDPVNLELRNQPDAP
jgi:hypothetical protein